MRGDILFKEFDRVMLDKTWKWLNDEEIRHLIMAGECTKEEQEQWFMTLNLRDDYWINGICAGQTEIGVIGLRKIDNIAGCAEVFTYIGEKDYWGRGVGSAALEYVQKCALKKDISTLYAKIAVYNSQSQRLFEKNGYKKVDENGTYITVEKKIK